MILYLQKMAISDGSTWKKNKEVVVTSGENGHLCGAGEAVFRREYGEARETGNCPFLGLGGGSTSVYLINFH